MKNEKRAIGQEDVNGYQRYQKCTFQRLVQEIKKKTLRFWQCFIYGMLSDTRLAVQKMTQRIV